VVVAQAAHPQTRVAQSVVRVLLVLSETIHSPVAELHSSSQAQPV
jgi:hypothetical protein